MPTSEQAVLAAESVLSKFCTFGFVASDSWDLTYIVISDGLLRLYDSHDTYIANPSNYVYHVGLSRANAVSGINSKQYNSETTNEKYFCHYFYLEVNNGIWSNTRLIKIGGIDREAIERLREMMKRAMA